MYVQMRREGWMLSIEREFMVTKEVMREIWNAKLVRENRAEKLKDKRDTTNQKDQVHIKKEVI